MTFLGKEYMLHHSKLKRKLDALWTNYEGSRFQFSLVNTAMKLSGKELEEKTDELKAAQAELDEAVDKINKLRETIRKSEEAVED